jgi:MerR family transcriptional regulator, thiopeptide resistance regulator
MTDGAAADAAEVMDLAEEHRAFISRSSFDCAPQMHTCLGEMYVQDERFTAYYEQISPGLARYLRDAIVANAARQG